MMSSSCLGCSSTIRGGKRSPVYSICLTCYNFIPWIVSPFCAQCGRQLQMEKADLPNYARTIQPELNSFDQTAETETNNFRKCSECIRVGARSFVCNRSAVAYSKTMKNWLALYKYRGDEKLLPLLAEMLQHAHQLLQLELSRTKQRIDAITYVPLSSVRMGERGFNQAERLAISLAREHKYPIIPLLSRARHTNKQSYKSRSDRLSDLHLAFELHPSIRIRQPSQHISRVNILLIDDVYTTGSTMDHCAEVLTRAFPCNIYGLTWAR